CMSVGRGLNPFQERPTCLMCGENEGANRPRFMLICNRNTRLGEISDSPYPDPPAARQLRLRRHRRRDDREWILTPLILP
ncbi:MAG: hypothetical protein KC442_25155, partial [Thermomicrobiales bacterium]|nr:hypothetical protein [Thermomicrobiales bacterium]